MISKITFETIKLYVWIGHYILNIFPFKWNSSSNQFKPTNKFNQEFVKLILKGQVGIKISCAVWFSSYSWFNRSTIEVWELTMNLFLISGLIITAPLFYMCLKAGTQTAVLLNSVLLLNKKITKFHGLPQHTNLDGLEPVIKSIRIAVILLISSCPIAIGVILEFYQPKTLFVLMNLFPFKVDLFVIVGVSISFMADAYIASGFVQFSVIMIHFTNEWLKLHVWRTDLSPKRTSKMRNLMRSIHLMYTILTEEYSYTVNPVYISTSTFFLVILMFLIVRFLTSLNILITIVLLITVVVCIYCMEISYKMGSKTIQLSPKVSQYFDSNLSHEDIKFIKSCPTLAWKIGVFYNVRNETFALIMSDFAIPSVINLLLSS